MLRRISVIIASAAMLALSAMPAFATSHSSTHKLPFPSLHGVQAWGTYQKNSRGVKLKICAKDTGGSFAVAAIALGLNSSGKVVTNFGAAALGAGTTQCRGPVTLRHIAHLRIFTFILGSNGRIIAKSAIKKVY
jgi:hypothetical protein